MTHFASSDFACLFYKATSPFFVQAITMMAAVVVILLLKRRSSVLPLPPGPRRLPIIGNLLDMPKSFPALRFVEMGKELKSDIIYLNVSGTKFLVLNSLQAADDLLDNRSSIYSGRPPFVMVNELGSPFNWNGGDTVVTRVSRSPGMPYGNNWKTHRRSFQQEFPNGRVKEQHHSHQLKTSRAFLANLLNDSESFQENTRLMAGSLLISVAYGIDVNDKNNRYIQNAERALEALTYALQPGNFLVDSIPWLKYVPEWFPGTGFKSKAREWRSLRERVEREVFDATKRDMANRNFQPSFVSNALQQILHDVDHTSNTLQTAREESIIRETASSIYEAGTETISSAFLSFFFAMVCYPECQGKAQKEIDTVVGDGRLPDLRDRDSLPYCEAIMKEVFSVEDEYRGYRIPRDTTVLSNVWSIFHNEEVYPNPCTFNPERWLKRLQDGRTVVNSDIPDITPAFGFGRRICPARHFALSAMLLNVASILAVFDLLKPVNESTGDIVEPSMEFVDSMKRCPASFKCVMRPRTGKHEKLVRQAMEHL
ncbi:cytochrome P450 [Marasmius fiardii PR-910]|nr:cytochrome P450 [Marasmius fiardii PR-910]KAF9256774.1 cytochrome P450 [Marasmius fiardii PR-910]